MHMDLSKLNRWQMWYVLVGIGLLFAINNTFLLVNRPVSSITISAVLGGALGHSLPGAIVLLCTRNRHQGAGYKLAVILTTLFAAAATFDVYSEANGL